MNAAYNMDCMVALKKIPDKYFDLAVVDPPYGIHQHGGKNKTRGRLVAAKDYPPFSGADAEPPPAEYFSELLRVSKNQIIWGANHFAHLLPNPSSPCWLVWDKMNGRNNFADVELAWTSFPCSAKIFHFRWAGMLQGDMAHKEVRIHPTQKPVALYTWILKTFAKPGDFVLDTHLGSGSSRIAAYDFGLPFVGFELDPFYFDEEEKRFAAHVSQHTLFDPPEYEPEQLTM